ncbi:MAG: YdcF family protein [Bacteroidia bacterium]|nr:YdcF family protein [Bacteroidia bacterium]
MFFLFSKLLHFLISPFTWILGVLIWGILCKDPLRKKKLFRWTLILFLFFSNPFIQDEFMRAWEVPAIADEKLEVHDVAVVLGGISTYDGKIDRIQMQRGADRLIQAIRLYKEGKVKRILFAGGSGSILHQHVKEGELIGRMMKHLGVPDSVVLIENDSKNTHENAAATRKLLDTKKPGWEDLDLKILLVTSASHMNRAVACFRMEGMNVTPYSTDRNSGERKWEFDHLFIPNVETLSSWDKLFHEWVGMVIYTVMGYV